MVNQITGGNLKIQVGQREADEARYRRYHAQELRQLLASKQSIRQECSRRSHESIEVCSGTSETIKAARKTTEESKQTERAWNQVTTESNETDNKERQANSSQRQRTWKAGRTMEKVNIKETKQEISFTEICYITEKICIKYEAKTTVKHTGNPIICNEISQEQKAHTV